MMPCHRVSFVKGAYGRLWPIAEDYEGEKQHEKGGAEGSRPESKVSITALTVDDRVL
jgi:hypothetical protein